MKLVLSIAAALIVPCGLACAQSAPDKPPSLSQAFPYEQMSVVTNPNGTERRMVFNGVMATGEAVGVHESTQPVGAPAPQLHSIQHSEIIVVRQGTIEFLHDGKADRLGPGSVAYVAFGTQHAIKNAGDVPAQYVVIQIGGDTKK
jgi:quercetin dioxygenase-like cupin family protein